MTATVVVVPAEEERDDVNNIIMTTEQSTNNDDSNNAAATAAANASDNTTTDTPSFCGVGGLDEMTLLPCRGGGSSGVGDGGEGSMIYRNSAYSSAAAALPRELISRLSLLPDENTSPPTTSTIDNNTYIPSSLLSCITPDNICGLSDLESQDENDPIPASVLANPNRTICVVTTAALPWRTGTAVNPLLRALYLVRYQREHCQNNEDNDNDITEQQSQQQKQTKGSVALVIPWLESSTEREKLYGSTNKFSDGHKGMEQQESWIKQYAKERCNMELEANELKYIWYPAFYLSGFGSIFPKVDLCNYIPKELVDVAILEEPEHLNWFRMPKSDYSGGGGGGSISCGSSGDDGGNDGGNEMIDNLTVDVDKQTASLECATTDDESITLNKDDDEGEGGDNDDDDDVLEKQKLQRINNKLGWTHRFQFVVGIVHTNYEEYARQYGIGASLIAAPAIGALSALTMRAYCHQVIKLSNTLPSFAPGKECTCNVHGVRREFLEEGTTECGGGDEDNSEDEISPVYFIGKLVWAKGFDVMIELQELFRKKSGDYFKVDIYGGGPDETAITRAFHGRNHVAPEKRPPPMKDSSSDMSAAAAAPTDPKDLNAAALFANPNSIKIQSDEAIEQLKLTKSDSDVISQYLSLGFETSFSKDDVTYVKEHRETNADPINILGDLSGKSFSTGVKTSQAVYDIADSSIKNILKMSFSKLKKKVSDVTSGGEENSNFVFDPPKSRYEWRRHPIPAKFPGVIDHAQLNNPRHKIFLNPSTSEVLCTTSAEALAMGKFVILPNHPSNEFFLQFTNCLAYDTLEECATKMMWALENEPTPLSPEERRIFTWEAATERLMESSLVSIKEARERASNGMDKTDARIAYWLSESGKIRGLFKK